ncbi:SDR family oxidoreductase [Actinomadura geliboluensis]|uniref:SDR family oxidoreductase n=1 Tax=Actinomadura geliboluensis TaxID=882440 RepID=UPI0037180773
MPSPQVLGSTYFTIRETGDLRRIGESEERITAVVAGATGRLGRHVVDVLTERGHQVVPVSRATGVDIITGEALTGADVVIDVASWHASDQEAATEFFRTSARNLHEAGRKAGVARIAMASIIGVDGSGMPDAEIAGEFTWRDGVRYSLLRTDPRP